MKLWAVEHFFHHFWVGATANPPKSEDGNGQLTRVAFKINDFLWNPYFSIIENYLFDLLNTTPLNITSMLQTLHSLLMHNSDCIHGFQGKQFVDFGVGLHER